LNQPIAATRVEYGSVVDFGSLTRNMVRHLTSLDNFPLHLSHSVKSLRNSKSGRWRVTVRDAQRGEDKVFKARFACLVAGGGALHMMRKFCTHEIQGHAGFPVSGQWLGSMSPSSGGQHRSMFYGKTAVGAPRMWVPHVHTRLVSGCPARLF